MDEKKIIAKTIFEQLVNLFAGLFLYLLIWAGAVMALVNSGEMVLAILLTLSGFAWVYKEEMRRRDIKTKRGKK